MKFRIDCPHCNFRYDFEAKQKPPFVYYNCPSCKKYAGIPHHSVYKIEAGKLGRPIANTEKITIRLDSGIVKHITQNGKTTRQQAIKNIIDNHLFRENLHAEIEHDTKATMHSKI
jgi:hypothetical protein